MPTLAERSLRVAMTGVVPADDPHIIADMQAEIERLRAAIAAIQQATVDGRVCDDVAWFDGITTLHDFCDQTLNAPT